MVKINREGVETANLFDLSEERVEQLVNLSDYIYKTSVDMGEIFERLFHLQEDKIITEGETYFLIYGFGGLMIMLAAEKEEKKKEDK